MPRFSDAESAIIYRLDRELPRELKYHDLAHTQDVHDAVCRLAVEESLDNESTELVRLAALLHDTGFIYTTAGHEARSCQVAREMLPEYDYSEHDIELICRMIMATQLPQSPSSLAEQILCDADLDYLGRDDFFEIGDRLYEEFRYLRVVENVKAWDQMQIRFFESHHYFTETSRRTRNSGKQQNLDLIRARLASNS